MESALAKTMADTLRPAVQARGLGSPVHSVGDVSGEGAGAGAEDRLRKMGRHLGDQTAKLGTHFTAASSAVAHKLSDLAAGRRRLSGAHSETHGRDATCSLLHHQRNLCIAKYHNIKIRSQW